MFNIRHLWNRITKKDDADIVCMSLQKDGVEVSACGRVGFWRLETPLSIYSGVLSEAGWHGFSGAYADALRDCHLRTDPLLLDTCLALQELNDHISVIDPVEEQHYNDLAPGVNVVRK